MHLIGLFYLRQKRRIGLYQCQLWWWYDDAKIYCVQKPTRSRLSLTHCANRSNHWVEWKRPVDEEKLCGGKDLSKSQVLSILPPEILPDIHLDNSPQTFLWAFSRIFPGQFPRHSRQHFPGTFFPTFPEQFPFSFQSTPIQFPARSTYTPGTFLLDIPRTVPGTFPPTFPLEIFPDIPRTIPI